LEAAESANRLSEACAQRHASHSTIGETVRLDSKFLVLTKRIRKWRCHFSSGRDFPVRARTSRFRARISRWRRPNLPVRYKKFPFRFHRGLWPKPLERGLFCGLQLKPERIERKKFPIISLKNGTFGVETHSCWAAYATEAGNCLSLLVAG